MGPVYRHPGYVLNMGMGLPGGPKAGHIHGAVRAGREGSQSGVRGEDWVASVPHKRPAKCHLEGKDGRVATFVIGELGVRLQSESWDFEL